MQPPRYSRATWLLEAIKTLTAFLKASTALLLAIEALLRIWNLVSGNQT